MFPPAEMVCVMAVVIAIYLVPGLWPDQNPKIKLTGSYKLDMAHFLERLLVIIREHTLVHVSGSSQKTAVHPIYFRNNYAQISYRTHEGGYVESIEVVPIQARAKTIIWIGRGSVSIETGQDTVHLHCDTKKLACKIRDEVLCAIRTTLPH